MVSKVEETKTNFNISVNNGGGNLRAHLLTYNYLP